MLSATYLLVERVNREINAGTRYRTDADLYHTPEFWEVADGAGDCEDYSLAKRRALQNVILNWPEQLRLAVVFTETEEGQRRRADKRAGGTANGDHAVLIARVPEGDYLLDNRYPQPMLLSETRYTIDRLQIAGTRDWEQGAL